MRGARRGIVAYDVVVEHAANGVALLLGPFEQTIAAEEALLFAGNCGEEKRGAVCGCAARDGFGEQARGFDAYGDAGGIVVCAGSVGFGVHHVGWTRIVVAGDDEECFCELGVGAGEDGVDAFQRERLAGSALTGGIEFVDDDLELAAGCFGDFVEAGDDVITGAADAAFGIGPGRKGETGAAGDELVDESAHGFYVNALARYGGGWARQQLGMRLNLLWFGRIAGGALLRERGRDGCR